MSDVFAGLAALVVVLHLGFVVFVMVGGLLAGRWPWLPWVHLPAAAWAAFLEFAGLICPLTPLENALRARAGLDLYSADFVARYVFPMLYPEGFTRPLQVFIGGVVVVVNVMAYAWLQRRRRTKNKGSLQGF